MDFAIESGIPLKITGRGRRNTVNFPLEEMHVGDSFLIPCELSKKAIDTWRRRVMEAKKKLSYGKFNTAVVSDGLRIWRTE